MIGDVPLADAQFGCNLAQCYVFEAAFIEQPDGSFHYLMLGIAHDGAKIAQPYYFSKRLLYVCPKLRKYLTLIRSG